MLDLKALPLLRKNLNVFIMSDKLEISLVRTQKIKTDAGGWVKDTPQILDPQFFRLVPFKRRLYDFTAKTANGLIPNMDYVLVGFYTADILRDDEFDYQGDHYKVVSVEPKTADRAKTDRVVAQITIQVGDADPPEDA